MGLSRADLFSSEQNEIAAIAKSLAHPARIAILQQLFKANACINGDLVEEIGLAQATISQHLRELNEIGLIQGTIEGTKVSYCINPQRWAEIENAFKLLFEQFNPLDQSDCC